MLEKREKVKSLHDEKQKLLVESGAARSVLQSAEKALRELQNEFSRKKNRLEALQELDEKRAVYAPSVQKLFAEQAKIGVKFSGTLADKFNVEEKAEKAVENPFGPFVQTVLVETEEDANKTVEYLKKSNLGRIAVLVFPAKAPRRKARSVPPALAGGSKAAKSEISNFKSQISNLIGVSDDFVEILTEVFPREMAAELVENLGEAKTDLEKSFVDSEGDIVFGGKLFVSGKANANEKNSSLLAFKRELRELETAIKDLTKEAGKSEKETEKARQDLAGKEEEIVDLQSLIVQVERDLLSLEIQEKSARQETERAERHKKVVGEEIAQIEKELGEIQARKKEARTNAEKAEKSRVSASEKLSKITQNLNDARARTEAENAVLNEKRTLAATSEERRRSAQSALRRVENEYKEHDSRIARQNLEILETEGKQKSLAVSIAEIEDKISSAEIEQEAEQNELFKPRSISKMRVKRRMR